MDDQEYTNKYVNLRILKSVQEYLKSDERLSPSIYPIRVPEELLYQTVDLEGPDKADELIHHIFRMGLTIWSENLYHDVFGSQESLEKFIEKVKKRNRE